MEIQIIFAILLLINKRFFYILYPMLCSSQKTGRFLSLAAALLFSLSLLFPVIHFFQIASYAKQDNACESDICRNKKHEGGEENRHHHHHDPGKCPVCKQYDSLLLKIFVCIDGPEVPETQKLEIVCPLPQKKIYFVSYPAQRPRSPPV